MTGVDPPSTEITGSIAVQGPALTYVLITPARNEALLIESTIQSVIAQTILPTKWIIVSDGSIDDTDQIVGRYASLYPWIQLLRRPPRPDRQFAAKAHCFNAGAELVANISFDVIGNLDADITFEPDYFAFLLERFSCDPKLGVAGTPFVEDEDRPDQHTYAHRYVQLEHVSGACQLFRRKCFEAVGGYTPVEGGAVDWIAVTTARMRGWKTRTFPGKVCFHHRKLGTGNNNRVMVSFHYGRKAYYVGGHPGWILLRSIFRLKQKPAVVGGIFFALGYLSAWVRRMPLAVSPELAAFHQGEQMNRLRRLFRAPGSSRNKVVHAVT